MKYVITIIILLGSFLDSYSQTASTSSAQSFIYVSLDSLRTIALYRIDYSNGDLIFVNKIEVGGQPGSIVVDPSNNFLHAAIRSNLSISSFKINQQNGELTFLKSVNTNWNPVYLSMDQTGKYLLATYFSDNKAALFTVLQDGSLQSGATQILDTSTNPHSIRVDRSNKFVFVPCRTGESIHQYKFSESSGLLTVNSPGKISTPDSTGPRHIIFHPKLNYAYTSNEFGRSVSSYLVNSSEGTLTMIQTITMQPERPNDHSIAPNTGGADIHVTPDGKYLYATNRGPDTIAAYEIDQNTGTLKFIANYPTEKMPRSFEIDPLGKFIYVGGQKSGKISSYKIDSLSGKLSFIKSYNIGSNPVWISIIRLELNGSSGIGLNGEEIPFDFTLSQNYPNPFNSNTIINFSLSKSENISFALFDSLGRIKKTMLNMHTEAGKHRIEVSTTEYDLSSGIYFYRVTAGNNAIAKKMTVIK